MVTTNSFISASEARASIVNTAVIHKEISAIESMILSESAKGFLSIDVTDSTMAAPTLNSFIAITALNTTNNTITLAQSLPSGTPVSFSSTGTLPTTLATNVVYYLVALGNNVYNLAISKQAALKDIPLIIALPTAGSGTISYKQVKMAELYYLAWQNMYSTLEGKLYAAQMQAVIDYFSGLGYNIERKAVSNSIPLFYWSISW